MNINKASTALKKMSKEQDVVIGSHTLIEYKFQVLNFMSMLYDNINSPFKNTCMTESVVCHNLKVECSYVIKEIALKYTDYNKRIYDIISAIYYNITALKELPKKIWSTIINLNNILWTKLLHNIKYDLQIYEIED